MMRSSVLQLLLANFVVRGIAGLDITCEVLKTDITYEDVDSYLEDKDSEDEWNCVDDAGILYDFDGEWKRIFDEYEYPYQISGSTFTFKEVTIESAQDELYGLPAIIVANESEIVFEHDRRRLRGNLAGQDVDSVHDNNRRLQASFVRRNLGEQEVLVVRVTDKDGREPDMTAENLSKRVFGEYEPGSESVASHMNSCSGDQLTLVPSVRGSDIIDGVLSITIDVSVTAYTGDQRKDLEKVVTAELKTLGYIGTGIAKCKFDGNTCTSKSLHSKKTSNTYTNTSFFSHTNTMNNSRLLDVRYAT